MRFLFALLSALLSAYSILGKDTTATSSLLSAQFYCDFPCENNMGFYISSTTPSTVNYGVDNPRRIQMLLPPTNKAERGFAAFASYEEATKTFTTVAADFPTKGSMTVWVSTISGTDPATITATPVIEAQKVQYPVSSSPYPLNVAPLTLAKVLSGPNGTVFAIFTNGEVHALDTVKGTLSLRHRIISDERALDVSNPSTLSAHAYDSSRHGLWSVVTAGMFAYLVFTDINTGVVGDYLKISANMKMDPGEDASEYDFSPETFVNGFMVDLKDGKGPQFMVQLESLYNVGFDCVTFIDPSTGIFSGPVYNLMNYNLEFKCQEYNCDKDRLSAWDASQNTVWFQAHNTGEAIFSIAGLGFDTSVINTPTYYVWNAVPDVPFGYTNFHVYSF